ncbi:MAG: AAA family ATPase [Alphaproteobacteria bacterium]
MINIKKNVKLHIMVGYMGFGKTTIASQLSKEYNAIVLNHDDFMTTLFGRNPSKENFRDYKSKVSDLLWVVANKVLNTKSDVIIDSGAWSKEERLLIKLKAAQMRVDVIFHQIDCCINTAKQRVLNRTQTDNDAMYIDENCFNKFLSQYQEISNDEGLIVIHHKGE